MSVRINQNNCIGCGLCVEVCPGNLIKIDKTGKAAIIHKRDCWGCTSCLKECTHSAIDMFLGADMGGRGDILKIKKEKGELIWEMQSVDGITKQIKVNPKEANKY